MKCIIINPWIKTITESEFNPDDVETIRRSLGWVGYPCSGLAVRAAFPNEDNLIINTVRPEDWPSFKLGSIVVSGNGVIVGVDGDDFCEPKFMKVDLQDRIRFFG